MLRLIDWLKITDIAGLYVIIYEDDMDKPSWAGHFYDIPWIYTLEKFSTKRQEEGESPIEFRGNLGEIVNNKPGFIICLDGDWGTD